MTFIQSPHLPHSKVRLCAIGSGNKPLKRALNNLGIEVISIPASKNISQPVNNHADLLLHHAGGEKVWLDNLSHTYVKALQEYGFQINTLSEPLQALYLKETALCSFMLGSNIYANADAIDSSLLSYYQRTGKSLAPVKQGYTKCSVCLVNNKSVITSDNGLATALEAKGIHTLMIKPGFIQLPGYDYGFIGGCCGLLSDKLLAFYGDIGKHPDYKEIWLFCRQCGVDVISLCVEQPLTDIGGIIPLLQE